MNRINRTEAPDILKENAQKWNEHFVQKRAENPAYKFDWKTYKREKVNKILLPFLRILTQEHCSFCDGFPFDMSTETIEHFRPKNSFPDLVYDWNNLFLCCNHCQGKKLEKFDEKLLKPDESDYQFEEYFQCNYKTGELEPNETKDAATQERAEITIKMYDLNSEKRCKSRERTLKFWLRDTDENVDDFPYRYFLYQD